MPVAACAMPRPLRASALVLKDSPASPATSEPSLASSDPEMSNSGAKSCGSSSPTGLALNLAPVTNSEGKKVFRCAFPGCGREFQLKGNLKRHMNIHGGDKQFSCAWCGRGFLRKADMEVHTRVHTGEKPHACRFPGCDRSFARRSDLLSHERTHSGTKPFECAFPGCGRRFARKFDLHKHQRMHDAASGDKCKPKKRRLAPSTSSSSLSSSSVVSSPYGSPRSSVASLDMGVGGVGSASKTEIGTKATASVARQCIQCGTTSTAPAASAKPTVRYELKCTEDHVHSPPACFAAFSVTDPIDAFLAEDAPDFKMLSLIDLPPPTGPCGLNGHIFAPLPDFKMDEVTPVVSNAANPSLLGAYSVDGGTTSLESSTLSEGTALGVFVDAPGSEPFLKSLEGATLTQLEPKLSLSNGKSTPTNAPSQSLPASAESEDKAMVPVCIPAPIPSDLALNYSRHSRSCGHLSIQHGNHRDYVVHNHLVCQDSVKKLGDRPRSGSNCSSTGSTAKDPSAKCAPQASHGPGCGHLPVRHQDHIDYVVEDNLFCQRAGWLDDVDNIELLDDDFWEFYGAIGSLNTDELKQEQQEQHEQHHSDQSKKTVV